jgi:nucleoid-associated protein YejK
MNFNFGQLRVKAVIVHQIPRKDQGVPIYSEIESPLNDELKVYIRSKIIQSADSSSSFPIELHEETQSPVPKLITDYLNTGEGFVEKSRAMAEHLAKIQTRTNTAGLLTLVDCSLGTTRGLAVLKLERQSGISVDQETIDGKRTLSMEHIGRLMLTDAAKVFKAGVFQLSGGTLEAVASDHQRVQVDLAHFFLSEFLGCRLVAEPPVATKRFFDASEKFINERVTDPKTKMKYQIALAAELNSNRKQIRPRAFAEENVNTKDRHPYCEFMKEHGAAGAIDKNLLLVESRLAGLQMKFRSGATVYAPPAAIAGGKVTVEQDEDRARVVIHDELTSMKGKGRGKQTEESD